MDEVCEHEFAVSTDWKGDDDYGGWEPVIMCYKCGFDLCDLPIGTKLDVRWIKQDATKD